MRTWLKIAFLTPFLYFATVFGAALFYPGYSHMSQYASELGSASATYPILFNVGIFLTALACGAAGPGFYLGVKTLAGRPIPGLLAALCMGLFAFSLGMGSLFPMPDPRHGGYGLGLAAHFAPFLLSAALWRLPAVREFCLGLLVIGLIMLVLFAVMMGVGEWVTRDNVGLLQRIFALAMFPWIGVAACVLLRETSSAETDSVPRSG